MKRFIISMMCLLSVSSLFAQSFRSVGSNAEFCVYTFDGKYYLILSFRDDHKNRLIDYTIVKFKMADGTVIKFEGNIGSKREENSAYHIDYDYVAGNTKETRYAILPVTLEQIEQLNNKIERVAINTIPEVYKRAKWSGKDAFAQSLYRDFKTIQSEFED